MRMIFLVIFFISSCAHSSLSPKDVDHSLAILQKIWDSRNLKVAKEYFPELHEISQDKNQIVYGVDQKANLFNFRIAANKVTNQIDSMSLGLSNNPSKNNSNFIKSKIVATDWKTLEIPAKVGKHSPGVGISEFSEKNGVSFIYNKLDKNKRVWIIYWGYNPNKLELLF